MNIDETKMMWQTAPYPDALKELVDELELPLHPKWDVYLLDDYDRGQGCRGMTLDVVTWGLDSYHPERGETYRVHHFFIVPAAAYNKRSWQRWLFDQLMLVELHEGMEGFVIDGSRPYSPNHGEGHDPYIIRELATDEERRTSFKNVVKE